MGAQGRITSDMKVWKAGMEGWQSVSKVKGLQVTPVATEPPPIPQQAPVMVAMTPAPSTPPMPVAGHVTIEKHSKHLKFQQLIAIGVLVLGIVLTFAGIGSAEGGRMSTTQTTGGLATFAGIVWLAVTKARMWWHHG